IAKGLAGVVLVMTNRFIMASFTVRGSRIYARFSLFGALPHLEPHTIISSQAAVILYHSFQLQASQEREHNHQVEPHMIKHSAPDMQQFPNCYSPRHGEARTYSRHPHRP